MVAAGFRSVTLQGDDGGTVNGARPRLGRLPFRVTMTAL